MQYVTNIHQYEYDDYCVATTLCLKIVRGKVKEASTEILCADTFAEAKQAVIEKYGEHIVLGYNPDK